MPALALTLALDVRKTAPFGRNATKGSLRGRIKKFLVAEESARVAAAALANQVSRSSFEYLRPFAGAQRPGRSSTGGQMAHFINWSPESAATSVALDVAQLDQHAPHWIIQEIGTGQRATIREGGSKNPQGRPGAGATHVRTVRSQVGRRISPALVFADGPTGNYVPPIAARTGQQQLYLRNRITGAPARRTGIVIRREIKGQHFIKKGAEAGFREYQTNVLAAARNAFRKGAEL